MKLTILLMVCAVLGVHADECAPDVDLAAVINSFSLKLYKQTADIYRNHFVLGPYTIWLELAAIAEGATEEVQNELFDFLGLPKSECLRNKLYQKVPKLEGMPFGNTIASSRFYAFDDEIKINEKWSKKVIDANLIYPVQLPLLENPDQAEEKLRSISFLQFRDLHLYGSSMLIDLLDYAAIWKTGFPESKIESNTQFYGTYGQKMKPVDMMRFKKRVNMVNFPDSHTKVLQLPVGKNGRYVMIFVLNENGTPLEFMTQNFNLTMMTELSNLKEETAVDIDVAIPRFTMYFKNDMLRDTLDMLGLKNLWRDSASLSSISDPPSTPSGFIQNIVMRVTERGEEDLSDSPPLKSMGDIYRSEKEYENSFLADTPFMYFLLDTETKVYLISGSYAGQQPNSNY